MRRIRQRRPRASGRAIAALALLVAACGATVEDTAGSAGSASESAPSSTPAADGGAFDAETIAREFGDAVWQVEVDGCDIESGGSSFAVGSDLVITNRHVVEFDPTPTLVSRDGATVLEARVIGMSDEVDLAVLEVDATVGSFLEWAPTASLSEGQRVIALGYPSPFETFAVTVGTLNAFEVEDGVRVGVVSDEATDYGSSGGPLLTDRGLVAGIVTEFAEDGGRQVLGVSLTFDAVRSEIARIVAAPQVLEEDCTGAVYGTDPILDVLWDWCQADAMWACDELYLASLEGSDYEWFGATCGDRADAEDWCTVLYDAPEAFTFGDVAELDALWRECDAGVGEWADACDLLFSLAPLHTEYSDFGDSCGARNEPSDWCVDLYS
jgi:hypothetical protein